MASPMRRRRIRLAFRAICGVKETCRPLVSTRRKYALLHVANSLVRRADRASLPARYATRRWRALYGFIDCGILNRRFYRFLVSTF